MIAPVAHGSMQLLLPLQGAAAAGCMGCGQPQQQLLRQQQQQVQTVSLQQPASSAAGLASYTLNAQGNSVGGLHGLQLAGGAHADISTSAAAAAHTAAGVMPPPAAQPAAAQVSAPPPALLRLTDTRNLGQLALPSEVLQQLYGYLAPDDLQGLHLIIIIIMLPIKGLHLVNKYLSGVMLQQRVRQMGRLGACVAALWKLGCAGAAAAAAGAGDGTGDDAGSSSPAAAGTSPAAAAAALPSSAAAAAVGSRAAAVQPGATGGEAVSLQVDVAATQGSRQYELKHVSSSRQQLASTDSLIAQLAAAAGNLQHPNWQLSWVVVAAAAAAAAATLD
jgi:hypothetical protein